MKTIFKFIGSVLLTILSFYFWASYPWNLSSFIISDEEIKSVETKEVRIPEENPSVIKVLTWNLGFLYGEGSAGNGYVHRDKMFYEAKLTQAVKEIKSWDPDIIFFQEIDFSSHRSHFINQAEMIAKEAGYPYVAELISWDSNYVPFPFFPTESHFGKMQSGGAILSRYPLKSIENHFLSKPASKPWWYNLFYLYRYFQVVEVDLPNFPIKIVNLHLEAFDKENRMSQVLSLLDLVKKTGVSLVAGDFNMVPKSATKKSKFSDTDDYEGDQSYSMMEKSGLLEVIPDEIYLQNEKSYFTYPAKSPDRRLDYIFHSRSLKLMRAEVLSSEVSDHLPLKASFQIGPPKINPYSL